MPIRSNGYFNDPAFAQAAANLSSLFAPPSGSDAAGWAAANAKREEAARLAELFASGRSPSEQAALTGVQTYGATPQGFTYKTDQDNLTQRYGYDTSAATSRANNADDNARAVLTNRLDNQRAALGNLFQPLNQGQVRPEMPAEFGSILGLPTAPAVAGAPKPMSETELKAQILGEMAPELQQAAAFGSTPIEPIVTPQGPRNVTRIDAIGQEPFVNRGAQAKPDLVNYRTPDGRAGTAVYDETRGGLVDTQDGTPLPSGTQTFKAQAQGAVDDVLGKPAANAIDKQLIDIAVAKDTAVTLRDLIASSPASQGAVGWLRGTAQNIIQTSGELGQFMGGGTREVADAIQRGLADENLASAFDPSIPAIEMMSNLLAFQYAKTTTGERLSNEMLRASRAALGLDGITANQADAMARLNQAISRIEAQESILNRFRREGPNAGQAAPPSPAVQGAMPVAPGAAERWERGPDGTLRKVQ